MENQSDVTPDRVPDRPDEQSAPHSPDHAPDDQPLLTPPSGITAPAPDYSEAGVPSLDFVRDKIEGRHARALGATELAETTPEVRSFEKQAAEREKAAADKLEELRRSLRGDSG